MRLFPERLQKTVPIALILIGVLAMAYWFLADPTQGFTISEPGKDKVVSADSSNEIINIGEHFERFTNETSTLKGSWTRFRGGNSDNIKVSEVPLLSSFANKPPKILWSVELGEGHSGAAIFDGLVYVLDYDETQKADMLRCFMLQTGKEVWRRWYNVIIRRNHGISRTVPAVTEKYILTLGPRAQVMCMERNSGNFLWGLDIVKEFKSEIPLWYTGQCPLIINDVAILAIGGSSLLIGVDCQTGKVLWETPNPDGWRMSHSSIMPYSFKGYNMLVYTSIDGVVGVIADGAEAGTVLWKTNVWNKSVVAPSPVCTPEGKIFLTAGYGAGSMVLQLVEDKGKLQVIEQQRIMPGDGMSCEQQTPILMEGRMIGIMPKDAKSLRNQLVCVDSKDPTKIVWSSGSEARFGLGPYILADDKLFLLNDDGTLYIIQKNLKAYKELDHVKLFDGVDAWAPLAIADGYLVLRDSKKMICMDIKQ